MRISYSFLNEPIMFLLQEWPSYFILYTLHMLYNPVYV